MTSGGTRGVIEAGLRLRVQHTPFALCIVVDTEGSTYRKRGAVALVSSAGERVGTLSGGCLEPALEALGREALAANAPRLAELDTRRDDDLVFGSGSGCRGLMRVLALPVVEEGAATFAALATAHAAGLPFTLSLHECAPTLFDRGDVTIAPAPQLLLFGAGPELPPLARCARALGWRLAVIDARQSLLGPLRLAEVDSWVCARPAAGWLQLALPRVDAAIAMTHTASGDLEALQVCADSEARYIGLLGPPARRDELLASLAAEQVRALHTRLHAPVGLNLGGDGPETIALSIAAELQQHFSQA
jgi:xanthine dehydrogenase accessory factor